MNIYKSGIDYLYDELAVLEQGIRALLADFESKELEGQTPMSMRGLVVNATDIQRSFQAGTYNLHELVAFKPLRILAEEQIARKIDDSQSEGTKLPLASLSSHLGLSTWEKRCIVLCLAAELDVRYESWFGYLNDDVTLRVPTAELALRLLGNTEQDYYDARSLLAGFSTLGRFVLRSDKAAMMSERSMLRQPLRLDPRIISFLLETESLDSRLANICSRYDGSSSAPHLAFHFDLQDRLLNAVQMERRHNINDTSFKNVERFQMPFIQLSGSAGAGKKLHARHLAEALEQPLLLVKLDKLARDGEVLSEQLKQIVRESLLLGAIVCLDESEGSLVVSDAWPLQQERIRIALTFYKEASSQPVIVWLTRTERRPSFLPLPESAALVNLAVPVPNAEVRMQLWQRFEHDGADQQMLRQLADKYSFTAGQIAGMSRQAGRLAQLDKCILPNHDHYASASRTQVQHRLSELAEKQKVSRQWEDLIVPEEQLELLREACSRQKFSETVLNRWGFGKKLPYGRGLSMLFAGPPGTGKTMAAEVVAGELGLELYRIDLSRVVSKYIGETEKNLRELFAEAESSGAILFFDEGDSLFGKRTEVKDSNDRFANMEAAYLLQRIENFDGVSILATNLMQNMDEAFLRRMQVVVKFPFPDAAERERIFRTLLPKEAPIDEDLDLPFLAARIDASGGHIKNIVLSAAFMAASEHAAIGMRHMVRAARQELHKMGKIVVKESFEPYL